MWVQSEECPNPSQCHGNSPFKWSLSATYQQTVLTQKIEYGIGKVVGHVVTDQVAWVPEPLPTQVSDDVRFLLIYEAEDLNTLKQDGLVGLAPGSVNEGQKTLLESMYEQGQLRDHIFSLYLGLNGD